MRRNNECWPFRPCPFWSRFARLGFFSSLQHLGSSCLVTLLKVAHCEAPDEFKLETLSSTSRSLATRECGRRQVFFIAHQSVTGVRKLAVRRRCDDEVLRPCPSWALYFSRQLRVIKFCSIMIVGYAIVLEPCLYHRKTNSTSVCSLMCRISSFTSNSILQSCGQRLWCP